jgi:hypothetical protein
MKPDIVGERDQNATDYYFPRFLLAFVEYPVRFYVCTITSTASHSLSKLYQ